MKRANYYIYLSIFVQIFSIHFLTLAMRSSCGCSILCSSSWPQLFIHLLIKIGAKRSKGKKEWGRWIFFYYSWLRKSAPAGVPLGEKGWDECEVEFECGDGLGRGGLPTSFSFIK
jgi:hypothetical protein